jgi:tetratricopeptide (TPR) repeat protein
MKNQNVYVLGLALAATMGFGACNGLKKMQKKAATVNYTVTPNPLEMHGDSVAVTIKVTYPPKYFGKKVVLTVNPSLGGKNFKPATLLGEKAVGTGTKIAYKTGGSFTYTDKQAYSPEMKNTDFKLAATGVVKSKSKDMPVAKIGDGTIVTPLLVKADDKTIIGKDDFKAVLPRTSEAQIFFVISQSTVRPTEMNNESMKAMKAWVAKGMNHRWGMEFKGCDVSAYASPDGEMSMNANLANDRAKKSSEAFASMFKDKKMALVPAQSDAFYSKVTTAEDWEGFKRAMEASSIKDKDLVLRVLSQYPDGEVREKEIKNMAKTYTEIANDILPKLRRSVMTMKADEKQRPNDNILMLAKSSPDSLSVEEILYAATLTKDMNEQLSFYKAAEKKYPNDWRTSNNVGCMYLHMNKLQDAKTQFEKALAIDGSNKIVNNNMGIVYRWMGDRVKAMEYYKKAAGAGSEVSYNMGIVQIQNGAYADAVSSFGGTKDFNAALAKTLNGNLDEANTTLDGGADKEEGLSYYLRAIISARKGDAGGVVSNLGKAIAKDASFKEKAKEDMEFLKWRENAEFKSAVN